MSMFRALSILAILCLAGPVLADLPAAHDFEKDAEQAERGRMPIAVFFTSDSCPYCREVQELYLGPMVERGTYKGRVLFRYVEVTSGAPVRDFRGARTDHEAFASREGAFITPIIRFYDYTGKELVPPVIGYTSEHFYAGELENAIESSIARARNGVGPATVGLPN